MLAQIQLTKGQQGQIVSPTAGIARHKRPMRVLPESCGSRPFARRATMTMQPGSSLLSQALTDGERTASHSSESTTISRASEGRTVRAPRTAPLPMMVPRRFSSARHCSAARDARHCRVRNSGVAAVQPACRSCHDLCASFDDYERTQQRCRTYAHLWVSTDTSSRATWRVAVARNTVRYSL